MSRQLIFPHVSSQIATYLYLKNLTGTYNENKIGMRGVSTEAIQGTFTRQLLWLRSGSLMSYFLFVLPSTIFCGGDIIRILQGYIILH